MQPKQLITKYNVPGPRYTSYPTVPYWDASGFSRSQWISDVQKSFAESSKEGISLYIHLPFCESMCTFCGCNKRITKNHLVEVPYIRAVLKEFEMYLKILGAKPVVSELHLGGGTPTFFSPANLKMLLDGIFNRSRRSDKAAFSFEGHPNNTTEEHLKILRQFGFDRVSYGVQDYNERVQLAIRRIQPFESVKSATETARANGYRSVGHDLIFGLPFQTKEHVRHTVAKTIQLRPDRIAFYSYAHVPWIKGNGQRGFKDSDLPKADEKRAQYALGKQLLEEAGYIEIGMDHFALPKDDLYQALANGRLHRNFMGYTDSQTRLMIGLGVSSISDSWYGFAQNVKNIEAYHSLVKNGELPLLRGHHLTEEDLVIRQHILNLMCRFETKWDRDTAYFKALPDTLVRLKEMEEDGLLRIYPDRLEITDSGKPFVRNICMGFDLRLQRSRPETELFSMTI